MASYNTKNQSKIKYWRVEMLLCRLDNWYLENLISENVYRYRLDKLLSNKNYF